MIKGDILPTACVVTLGTLLAELSLMNIVGGMTSKARRGCTLENTIDMTGFAGHIHMHSS